MIDRSAYVVAGKTVLIHGGGGGVGTALLDLGRVRGIRTIATASTVKHLLVTSYGGEPIDYRSCDFVQKVRTMVGGVDAVFDHLGGAHLWRSRSALRSNGILVGYGFADAAKNGQSQVVRETFAAILEMQALAGTSATFYAILSERYGFMEHIASDLGRIMTMLERGQIRPHIGSVMPLAAASDAHALLEAGESSGKVVLDCLK